MVESLAGTRLGRFRITRLIGKGGMGEVYAALDEHLDREVAIKVLGAAVDVEPHRRRFLREARLAARLNHPNIASIHEVGDSDGRLYIVMELLEGKTLRTLMQERRLTMDECISIARDIARALARAHAGDVIHRDIKPENVFITSPAPDVLFAKVLDFGLARDETLRKQSNHEITATDLTGPGEACGTAGYLAPEQARGLAIDVRADVFSFGAVFYEMLTGKRAFDGRNQLQRMLAVVKNEPEPVRKLVPDVAPEVEELLECCLAKAPADRYADGGALAIAMEALLRGSQRAMPIVDVSPEALALLDKTAAMEAGGPMASRSPEPPDAKDAKDAKEPDAKDAKEPDAKDAKNAKDAKAPEKKSLPSLSPPRVPPPRPPPRVSSIPRPSTTAPPPAPPPARVEAQESADAIGEISSSNILSSESARDVGVAALSSSDVLATSSSPSLSGDDLSPVPAATASSVAQTKKDKPRSEPIPYPELSRWLSKEQQQQLKPLLLVAAGGLCISFVIILIISATTGSKPAASAKKASDRASSSPAIAVANEVPPAPVVVPAAATDPNPEASPAASPAATETPPGDETPASTTVAAAPSEPDPPTGKSSRPRPPGTGFTRLPSVHASATSVAAALPSPPPAPTPATAATPKATTGVVHVSAGDVMTIVIDGEHRRLSGGGVTVACGRHRIRVGLRSEQVVDVPCGGSITL